MSSKSKNVCINHACKTEQISIPRIGYVFLWILSFSLHPLQIFLSSLIQMELKELSSLTIQKNVIFFYYFFQNGDTTLMIAALNGHHEIVEVLLDKGAQINFDHEVKISEFFLASNYALCLYIFFFLYLLPFPSCFFLLIFFHFLHFRSSSIFCPLFLFSSLFPCFYLSFSCLSLSYLVSLYISFLLFSSFFFFFTIVTLSGDLPPWWRHHLTAIWRLYDCS